TKHEIVKGNTVAEDFMQRLTKERNGARLFKKYEDCTCPGQILKRSATVGQARNSGDIQNDHALIVHAEQPPLVLEPDDDPGVWQYAIRKIRSRLLDGKRPDERFEG